MIGLLLDLGNVAITAADVPQIITAIRNRRNLLGRLRGIHESFATGKPAEEELKALMDNIFKLLQGKGIAV